MDSVRIREIYRSIQGESTFAGWPCTFIRTAGCDIRCVYCDEPESLKGGESLTIDRILERVAGLGSGLVEVTGGEPLLQPAVPGLVELLLDRGWEVLVETGGHHDISVIDPRAHRIVDVKAPGSGVAARTDLANLDRLRPGDEIKLVLMDRADYEWARDVIRERDLADRVPVNLSPVHGLLDPRELVRWTLQDGLHARLNLQLHKVVWGADARGV